MKEEYINLLWAVADPFIEDRPHTSLTGNDVKMVIAIVGKAFDISEKKINDYMVEHERHYHNKPLGEPIQSPPKLKCDADGPCDWFKSRKECGLIWEFNGEFYAGHDKANIAVYCCPKCGEEL